MDYKFTIYPCLYKLLTLLSQLSGKLCKLNINLEAIHSDHDQVSEICIKFNKFDLQLGASDKFSISNLTSATPQTDVILVRARNTAWRVGGN